jgi:hypothetical protein
MLGCSSLDAYELSSFASRMSWFAGSPASDQFRLGGRDPLSKPATLRSSSASGQWIPSPSPSSSQRCRCSSEALSSRGNHSNGTASLRPSARSTRSSCSVTSTCLAKGRTSTVEVFIPALQEFCPILLNQSPQLGQFVAGKTSRPSQPDRFQPELRQFALPLSVDVRWFEAFVAIEEEPERANPLECRRHGLG